MYFLNTLFVVIACTLPASYLAFLIANESEFVNRHEKGFYAFLTVVRWACASFPVAFILFLIFASSPEKQFGQFVESHSIPGTNFPTLSGYFIMALMASVIAIDTMKDVALYRKFVNSGDETTSDFNFFTRRVMALYYWFLTFTRFIYDAIFNVIRFRKISFGAYRAKKEPEIVQAKEEAPKEEIRVSRRSQETQDILDKLDKF